MLAKITAVPREPQVEGSSATVMVEISGVDMRAVTGSLGSDNPKESKDVQQILPALLRLLERENVPMTRTLVEHQLVKEGGGWKIAQLDRAALDAAKLLVGKA